MTRCAASPRCGKRKHRDPSRLWRSRRGVYARYAHRHFDHSERPWEGGCGDAGRGVRLQHGRMAVDAPPAACSRARARSRVAVAPAEDRWAVRGNRWTARAGLTGAGWSRSAPQTRAYPPGRGRGRRERVSVGVGGYETHHHPARSFAARRPPPREGIELLSPRQPPSSKRSNRATAVNARPELRPLFPPAVPSRHRPRACGGRPARSRLRVQPAGQDLNHYPSAPRGHEVRDLALRTGGPDAASGRSRCRPRDAVPALIRERLRKPSAPG